MLEEIESNAALAGEAQGMAEAGNKYAEHCLDELENHSVALYDCERRLLQCARVK